MAINQKHSRFVKPINPDSDSKLVDGVFNDRNVQMRTQVREFLGTKSKSEVYD